MSAIPISSEYNVLVESPPISPEFITFDEGHLISPEHIMLDVDVNHTISPEHIVFVEERSISPEHIALVEGRIIEIVSKQIEEYTFDFKQPIINEICCKYSFEKIFQIESDPLVKLIGSAVLAKDKSILETLFTIKMT